jgi:hypothetical protein
MKKYYHLPGIESAPQINQLRGVENWMDQGLILHRSRLISTIFSLTSNFPPNKEFPDHLTWYANGKLWDTPLVVFNKKGRWGYHDDRLNGQAQKFPFDCYTCALPIERYEDHANKAQINRKYDFRFSAKDVADYCQASQRETPGWEFGLYQCLLGIANKLIVFNKLDITRFDLAHRGSLLKADSPCTLSIGLHHPRDLWSSPNDPRRMITFQLYGTSAYSDTPGMLMAAGRLDGSLIKRNQ